MDSFKEQIVRKELSQREKTSKYLLMIASVALAAACFMFLVGTYLMMIGVLLAGLALFGGYQLTTRMDLEYEYIFTSGEVDVDKIVAQRSRKRLVTFKCQNVTAIGKDNDSFEVPDDHTLVIASANNSELDDYYISFKHKSLGNTTVIFTPEAEMLTLIVKALPAPIRKDAVKLLEEFKNEDDEE